MNKSAVSAYVRALFDVAVERREAERVGQELAAFESAVSSHAELRTVLANPAVPASARRAVATAVADASQVSPVLRSTIALLAERNETALLPAIARGYDARLRHHLGIVEAEVTTAVPLPKDRADRLLEEIAGATGRKVRLSLRIDPAILGGVVTKIGSTVYDGSVARQLERLQTRMADAQV
jgi:F-type H+-transporting ATPase subunit delta